MCLCVVCCLLEDSLDSHTRAEHVSSRRIGARFNRDGVYYIVAYDGAHTDGMHRYNATAVAFAKYTAIIAKRDMFAGDPCEKSMCSLHCMLSSAQRRAAFRKPVVGVM